METSGVIEVAQKSPQKRELATMARSGAAGASANGKETMSKIGKMFGRLGTLENVTKALKECKDNALETCLDERAGTAKAWFETAEGKTDVFAALCKGGDTWLCMYARGYWPEN